MYRLTITAAFLVFSALACAPTPRIARPELAVRADSTSRGPVTQAKFDALSKRVRGRQVGDDVFLQTTSARWILPEIDAMRLRLAQDSGELNAAEAKARLKRLNKVHERFWVFAVELHLPFYSGWTQSQLLDFLDANLVSTLDLGDKRSQHADRQLYLTTTTPDLGPETSPDHLEVVVPLRLFFARQDSVPGVRLKSGTRVVLKLRLRRRPPFRIGFFDEKYYQGFVWQVE